MGVQRTVLVRVVLLALLSVRFAAPAFAATTIGLYTDESGSSCSFSGNTQGVVTAYVVVRPDGDGVRGIRFAAPLPACFGATWLSDTPADGVLTIGDSQTGISLATSSCGIQPQSMLQILYYRSTSTTPCCAFPIVADPATGSVEVTTCTFAFADATPITSHMNADATCACSDDVAPMPPSNPGPPDGGANVIEWPSFSWTGQDWDGDLTVYDVYLGYGTLDPPLVATVNTPSYELSGPLAANALYYWRVVAHDAQGHETSSPLWSFTVGKHNNPPSITLTSPLLGSSFNPANISLMWSASDPDGNPMVFDVYLGTTDPPPFVATRTTMQYNTLLSYDTMYYWRVVARDAPHSETSSPTFNFRTRILNNPPVAGNPSPAHNTINVPVDADLGWTADDPDGDAVHCDVYLGASPNASLVATNVVPDANHHATFDPGPLSGGTIYNWFIKVYDARGASSTGPTWIFSTGGNHAPNTPTLISPPDGATGQSANLTLSWSASDPDPGQALRYDVYVGTTPSPPQGFSLLTTTSVVYHPSLGQIRYYWKVIAKDPLGEQASSPVFSFITAPNVVNAPPTVPSNPHPPDNGSANTAGVTLQWTSTDPEGLPLSFTVFFGTTTFPITTPIGGTSQPSFNVGPLVQGQRYYWMISASDGVNGVLGPVWSFVADNPVPVLFSSFGADVNGTAARVRWELQGDEPIVSYSLFRRLRGASSFSSLTNGAVTGTRGEYLDRSVEAGKKYEYQVLIRTAGGNEFRSQTASLEMPALELTLGQNHPNPFNPLTTIPYVVPSGAAPVRVRLAVYDTGGRMVRVLVDESQGGGAREVVWNGDDASGATVSSGVYLCVLQVGKERRTQKLVLLK